LRRPSIINYKHITITTNTKAPLSPPPTNIPTLKMTSPTLTTDELVALALGGSENMISAAEEREQNLPHTFLSLAPTTSSSYPLKPAPKTPVAQDPVMEATAPEAEVVTIEGLEKTRRSSSLSSNGSLSQKRRFLKLGPVHHGMHQGEEGDFSEVVIE
jgi:hypothetical protein